MPIMLKIQKTPQSMHQNVKKKFTLSKEKIKREWEEITHIYRKNKKKKEPAVILGLEKDNQKEQKKEQNKKNKVERKMQKTQQKRQAKN